MYWEANKQMFSVFIFKVKQTRKTSFVDRDTFSRFIIFQLH